MARGHPSMVVDPPKLLSRREPPRVLCHANMKTKTYGGAYDRVV